MSDERIKGVSFVWLSETGLTNMNSGEGESNLVDIKKYVKEGVDFPYVSGQAMRHYFRDAVRRGKSKDTTMCVPDDKGETCGDIKECINCDLFGFMSAKSGRGADTRVSPVKVSPAMGLLPLAENMTLDFLTRKKTKMSETDKQTGDIVNVELATNLYKCGISVDIARVGGIEKVDQKELTSSTEFQIEPSVREERIDLLLSAIRYLTGYSKQARLLTDLTPDVIVGSVETRYSHRLQKALSLKAKEKSVDIDRLKAVIKDMKDYATIYLGIIPGVLDNEDEIRAAAAELEISVGTPAETIDAIRKQVKGEKL